MLAKFAWKVSAMANLFGNQLFHKIQKPEHSKKHMRRYFLLLPSNGSKKCQKMFSYLIASIIVNTKSQLYLFKQFRAITWPKSLGI